MKVAFLGATKDERSPAACLEHSGTLVREWTEAQARIKKGVYRKPYPVSLYGV